MKRLTLLLAALFLVTSCGSDSDNNTAQQNKYIGISGQMSAEGQALLSGAWCREINAKLCDQNNTCDAEPAVEKLNFQANGKLTREVQLDNYSDRYESTMDWVLVGTTLEFKMTNGEVIQMTVSIVNKWTLRFSTQEAGAYFQACD
ncbi:hypothetical protein [Bacteriovorax sp. Seq25_V]|uniref:hypothetical protein n=1 Tax=Bacteriovorax sp. Seq25_V TaxID=1201288 RepID=UPI00038A1A68|nr:hypothetical protein [Bacteriovorax sp. Seq25_V]EQC46098.1 putative lipoprotein [Bacteriovorax sp. Seq25_V]